MIYKVVNCKHCGKEFKAYFCRTKIGRKKYCSRKCYWKSMEGKKRNYIVSLETREKLRKRGLGRKHTPEELKKMSLFQSGSKNPNWKGGISHDKKRYNQYRKALEKNGGELLVQTIQLVYEDNIKRFGTLTCYLCLNPITFGQDSLEHKTPLSRGGTNEYNNLAIACKKCNNVKHTRTEKEYRKTKMRTSA